MRTVLELIFFLVWIFCTGLAGYFVGHAPSTEVCPPPPPPEIIHRKAECIPRPGASALGSGTAIGAAKKEGGYTLEELSRMWKCSHAEANFTQANKKLFPKERNLDKTKWKTILSVEPKAFFDRYLSQYPGDTRAVQPVVVFSHKPLETFQDIPEVCKVIDVAIVPDTPGVCVAVTETFHDVASYHMLHADRQPDGTFALTANSLEGRTLPDEKAYAGARALLIEFFNHGDAVTKAVKQAPRYGQNKVAVGCLVEDLEEATLFRNSLESAYKVGVSKTKFCVFTTNQAVVTSMQPTGVKVIFLPELAAVGLRGDADVGGVMRRYFLQAWLAFAVANSLNKMLWQSPGTIWLERPDNIVNIAPLVEVLWAYKGRNDKRAAPFFCSFDFFAVTGAERAIHLMHEIVLHFDLVLAWNSLDALSSYRLSENNARCVLLFSLFSLSPSPFCLAPHSPNPSPFLPSSYGTTTFILPPFKVLHVELMAQQPAKIIEAVRSPDHPLVVVVPREGMSPSEAKALLQATGLWFLQS